MKLSAAILLFSFFIETSLFADKFKFCDPEQDEWVESSDFQRTLKHYKGLGTIYEIEGHGKYRVHKETAETSSTRLTSSPSKKERLGAVMKTLRDTKDATRLVASFNGKDQITFLMERDSKLTILYLLVAPKAQEEI